MKKQFYGWDKHFAFDMVLADYFINEVRYPIVIERYFDNWDKSYLREELKNFMRRFTI